MHRGHDDPLAEMHQLGLHTPGQLLELPGCRQAEDARCLVRSLSRGAQATREDRMDRIQLVPKEIVGTRELCLRTCRRLSLGALSLSGGPPRRSRWHWVQWHSSERRGEALQTRVRLLQRPPHLVKSGQEHPAALIRVLDLREGAEAAAQRHQLRAQGASLLREGCACRVTSFPTRLELMQSRRPPTPLLIELISLFPPEIILLMGALIQLAQDGARLAHVVLIRHLELLELCPLLLHVRDHRAPRAQVRMEGT